MLALASPRDQHHAEAVAIARRFAAAGGRWIGTPLVLGEVHGHLLHRRGPEVARAVVSDLLEDPAYQWAEVSAELVRQAIADWLLRYRDQRFSLTDAVSFAVMRKARIASAFAFDSDFVTAGFSLLR